MIYDPKLQSLIIGTKDADKAYYLIMYALKKARLVASLPLDKYELSGLLTEHDHLAIAIIEMAETLGISVGVTPHNHNKLDLRDI